MKSDCIVNRISQIFCESIGENPKTIERCSIGQGNYVYIVECENNKYVFRCSEDKDAYKDTLYWLERLAHIDIPVPSVLGKGMVHGYEYIILSYFEGQDIGEVYSQLKGEEKRSIAHEIVEIQNKVTVLELEDIPKDWSWMNFIDDMLRRAKERIIQNGYFDADKADELYELTGELEDYFTAVKPIAYLDDVSTKNLLIYNGHVSGIVDVDWMGIGDKLTYVALTNMALLNMDYDTDYVTYILDEMKLSAIEEKAFLFYTLMYCVDFMGERGMQFMDKVIEVNDRIIYRLNCIYDELMKEWNALG